jgi:hypothetical protein
VRALAHEFEDRGIDAIGLTAPVLARLADAQTPDTLPLPESA